MSGRMRTRMEVLSKCRALWLAAFLFFLGWVSVSAAGQSPAPGPVPASIPATGQEENPFPGLPQSGVQPGHPNLPPAKPIPDSENPFPGEATGGNGNSGSLAAASGARGSQMGGRGDDPDGDPVRTPDTAGLQTEDGFSSSRTGLTHLPAEDDSDGQPGKSTKNKTREERIKEDRDVGNFYLDKHNWKAAQGRFSAAFLLDPEDIDSIWGLAEAERHLGMVPEAIRHYELFLSYDGEGPHGRAARKALDQLMAERSALEKSGKLSPTEGLQPK